MRLAHGPEPLEADRAGHYLDEIRPENRSSFCNQWQKDKFTLHAKSISLGIITSKSRHKRFGDIHEVCSLNDVQTPCGSVILRAV